MNTKSQQDPAADLQQILDTKFFSETERATVRLAITTLQSQRKTLTEIYDTLGIGVVVRDRLTLLTNLSNLKRRVACLDAIERKFFTSPVPGEHPDEPPADMCVLNWGAGAEQYAEDFGRELAARAVSFTAAPGQDADAVPDEGSPLLHLARFLCRYYGELDTFVYEHCDPEALAKYPVLQGTRNQLNLRRIGEQAFDQKKVAEGVAELLKPRVP